MKYQRQWTLGADYTFGIGNGLTVLTEYFRFENPESPFASASGRAFSALSLSYPHRRQLRGAQGAGFVAIGRQFFIEFDHQFLRHFIRDHPQADDETGSAGV
jgi:hypothetical protein